MAKWCWANHPKVTGSSPVMVTLCLCPQRMHFICIVSVHSAEFGTSLRWGLTCNDWCPIQGEAMTLILLALWETWETDISISLYGPHGFYCKVQSGQNVKFYYFCARPSDSEMGKLLRRK